MAFFISQRCVRIVLMLQTTGIRRMGSLVPKQVRQNSPLMKHQQERNSLEIQLLRSYTNMSHKYNRSPKFRDMNWTSWMVLTILIGGFCLQFLNWNIVPKYLPWMPDFSSLDDRKREQEKWDDFNYLFEGKVPEALNPELRRMGFKEVDAAELLTPERSVLDLVEGGVDKKKDGFRERKIIEYENRIRAYSTPDKVFRLFATLKIHDPDGSGYGIYMTPDDFVRAITPGIRQPEGLGLDHFREFDPEKDELSTTIPKDSIFHQIGANGLISFSDYLFLMTLLAISTRHIEIAFKIFDVNGDGNVDAEEFEEILTVLRQQTSVGMRHREAKLTGSSYLGSAFVNSGLKKYFFGPSGKSKLKMQDFLTFQARMKDEVLRIEFNRMEPNQEGKITERQFAKMLLSYAGMSDQKQKKMLKRVKERFVGKASKGINFQQVHSFSHVFRHLNDVDTALGLYHVAGGSIDQATLQRIVKTVAKADLDDHIVDVVFTLFDDNDDGRLSQREFISIMKARQMRGMERPKDLGASRLLGAVWKCAKDEVHGVHH